MERIRFFAERHRWREAIEAGREALQADPESIEIRHALGWCGIYASVLELARRMATELMELAPDSPYGLDLLSELAVRDGQRDSAEQTLQEAIRLDPEEAHRYSRMAWIFARRGRLEDAISMAQQSLQLDPENVSALITLYGLSMWNEDTDRAAALEQQIGQRDPESADWHLFAGAGRLKSGQSGEARERFREAIRLDPGAHEAFEFIATQLTRSRVWFRHAFMLRDEWDIRLVALCVPLFWYLCSWLWSPLKYLAWASVFVIGAMFAWEAAFRLVRRRTLSRLLRGRL